MTDVVIHRVTTLDLKVEPWDWPFARERRADIDAHFEQRQRAIPALFNGRVLLLREPRHQDGVFHARYFETDYATFLAARDWGWPDRAVFNGFGMGALRGSDGVFVLGEMAQQTANAGRIYFASGTPDTNDLRGAEVDMAGSVARELAEETGLTSHDYRAASRWHTVETEQYIALMQPLEANVPGADLRRRILDNLAAQTEPELAGVHLVRDRRDLTATMPLFIRAYIEAMLAA
jgi:hypothetical protein